MVVSSGRRKREFGSDGKTGRVSRFDRPGHGILPRWREAETRNPGLEIGHPGDLGLVTEHTSGGIRMDRGLNWEKEGVLE